MKANLFLAQAQSAAPATTTSTTTPAEAPNGSASAPEQGGLMNGMGGMLPIILIIVVMFYLTWRGQKKERKRREDMVASIRKDMKIITVGGIMGVVTEVKETSIKIKVSDSAELEITKGAVGQVVSEEGEAKK